MRDYLGESQDWLDSPVPIREMLAKDYNVTLAAIGSRLRFEDTYVRKYAAYSLGQIGDPRMEEYLERALTSENVEGVRHAMVAALKTIRKMPAGSGATEEQRCQYMQEVYEAGLPEHIRQKMLANRASGSGTESKNRSSVTPTKASSGCLLMIVTGLSMIGATIVFLVAR